MNAKRIKEIRLEAGFTQQQTANALKISRTTYANYEQGLADLNTNTLSELCKIWNVSADYILGLENYDGTKTYDQRSYSNKGEITYTNN
jgi:transcriptional regulator with XRE-family HTH domain